MFGFGSKERVLSRTPENPSAKAWRDLEEKICHMVATDRLALARQLQNEAAEKLAMAALVLDYNPMAWGLDEVIDLRPEASPLILSSLALNPNSPRALRIQKNLQPAPYPTGIYPLDNV